MRRVCKLQVGRIQGDDHCADGSRMDLVTVQFFGWGRKSDPPPIANLAHPKFKYSDIPATWSKVQSAGATEYGRSSDHLVGSLDDQAQYTPPRRVVLAHQARPSKDLLDPGARADSLGAETWEETWLQETIRFVFSNEQEGLLAIGTFALDQLTDSGTHLDNRQSKPPAAVIAGPGALNSCRKSVSTVQVVVREVRSSDDETDSSHHSMRSPILGAAQCKSKEPYPVFGDHDASSWGVIPLCPTTSVGSSTATSTLDHQPPCTANSAPNTNTVTDQYEAEMNALATPATKNQVPSSTVTLVHDESSSDQDSYLPGLCGLFAARSPRSQKHGWKEKRKKQKGNSCSDQLKEANCTKAGDSRRSTQVGRLWRSLCTGSSGSGSKVSPEKKLNSCDPPSDHQYTQPQAQGPPCIANIVEEVGVPAVEEQEQRIKRRGHSFGKGWGCGSAHNGKWIRTDSEFVVLEM